MVFIVATEKELMYKFSDSLPGSYQNSLSAKYKLITPGSSSQRSKLTW